MYKPLLILALFFNSSIAFTQAEHERRIRVFDIYDRENVSFFRRGTDLGTLVLQIAKEGSLPIYIFEGYNTSPELIDTLSFKERLRIYDEANYWLDVWEESWVYDDYYEVLFDEEIYININVEGNIGKRPDLNPEYWEIQEPQYIEGNYVSKIQVDEQYFNDKWNIQYFHLLTEGYDGDYTPDSYLCSFKFIDLINSLEDCENVWYENYMGDSTLINPLGHVIGSIFNRSYGDNIVNGLLSNDQDVSDTIKYIFNKKLNQDQAFGTFVTYQNKIPDSVFIYSGSGYLLDSLEFDQTKLRRGTVLSYRDAMIKEKYKTELDDEIKLTPLLDFTSADFKTKGLPKQLQVTTRERIDIRHPSGYKFRNLWNMMLRDIEMSIDDSTLVLYENEFLQGYNYTEEERVKHPFTYPFYNEYDENLPLYEADFAYLFGESVHYLGTDYISIQDDNIGNEPPFSGEFWETYEHGYETIPIDEILIMDIEYKTIFTPKGKIKTKHPERITLVHPADYSYEGLNMSVGTLYFSSIERKAEEEHVAWIALLKALGEQTDFRFQMTEYLPAKIVK